MTENDTRPQDAEVAAELEGVPSELTEGGDALAELVEALKGDLEAAKQDVLYAKAETQNVRRRMEKDIADARSYAATAFARDILSVADNLSRALESIPAELRADDKMKNLVAGLEATGREIEKVFASHGISRIAAKGLPLDPHQHQAMLEIPSNDVEPGTVLQELQAGYMIKDRLLRAAMVAVAKKPD
ncbi:MAG: nucleotide exchange factor GrpE [Novosphingobium sp.]|uniref:nucleotide exchange factor GrpE n=1 Tax=Novosphingobium sp. TaxID=1874826 RepID=UPI001DDDF181|nr:nucleotide exchange factor GrpE [Novosphingobium sp.]MBX9664434.1 nucleotide exchange factor GrpE [Novosphingobium sp.]MBY0394086.1 nucleotide exchange factor GrpE [Novosphingobium sp.]